MRLVTSLPGALVLRPARGAAAPELEHGPARPQPRLGAPSSGRWRRRRAAVRRRRSLVAAAAAATGALATAEVLRIWHRGRAPAPARPRELVRGGGIAARETVDVLRAGYRAASADETAVLNLFLSFGGTFAVARAVTHSIRRGIGPLRNVRIGDRHIHHFVPGIVLTLLAGGTSIGMRRERLDRWLALPFGTGAALIVDETALLIELSDVYWSHKGALSVDVGLGATTTLAGLALVVRLVRRGEAIVLGDREGAPPLQPPPHPSR
jgi:hypothetical protein